MSYRPWLEERALRQMGGLPPEALDVLVRALARICEDPYDRLFSRAVRNDDPRERMAELGDLGFVEFRVDEAAGLVRVQTLVWAGLLVHCRIKLCRIRHSAAPWAYGDLSVDDDAGIHRAAVGPIVIGGPCTPRRAPGSCTSWRSSTRSMLPAIP